MELDLTRLNSLAFTDFKREQEKKQAPESPTEPRNARGEYKTLADDKKPVEGLTEGLQSQQAVQLHLGAKREQEERQRTLEIYRTYQENIRRANMIKSEIVTGLQSGADPTLLLLKAVEAIARMTDDTVFEKTVRRTLDGRTAK